MSYTKGKWRQGLNNERAIVCDTIDGKILTIAVTEITRSISEDEAEKNAKLIAAAPELLEACLWAVEQFKILADKGLYPEHLLTQNGGDGMMPLVKVIEKATSI